MAQIFTVFWKQFLFLNRFALWGLFILLCSVFVTPTLADKKALLQLDTGGSHGTIWDVAFTHDGRQLVSVGDDKVVRIWSLKKGKTVRIFGGEADEGSLGKLYALALSPDDRWLAVAGWANRGCDGTAKADRCGDIRIYDMHDGRIKALLKGHGNVVKSLAFSSKGELLSGSDDATAILWDIQKALKGQQNIIKVRYDAPDSEYVTSARFLSAGKRIVTSDSDGILRIWRKAGGKPLYRITAHENEQRILALDVSPKGKLIATGSTDGTLRLFDAKYGKHIRTIKQGNYVSAVKFSPDGKNILTGMAGSGPWVAHVWDVASGKELVSYKQHDNVVNAVAISPNGKWAITAGGDRKVIHQWDLRSGKLKQKMHGIGSSIFAVGFEQKGKRLSLLWGRSDPCPGIHSCPNKPGNLEYRMRLPSGHRSLQKPRSFSGSKANITREIADKGGARLLHQREMNSQDYGVLDIQSPHGNQKITRYDYSDGKEHLSYSLTPDGNRIISGGRGGILKAYNISGSLSKAGSQFEGHTGPIWSLAVSPDGRFVVSGSDDQTVRLWNVNTGELIVSLFHGIDNEWIMWTPQGFYTSSANGDKMVGWQINQGPAREARFLSAEQLKDYLHKPFVVNRAILLGSAQKAAEEYYGEAGDPEDEPERRELQDLLKLQEPDFDILSPKPDQKINDEKLNLQLRNNNIKAGDLEYAVWVNDIKIAQRRGIFPMEGELSTSDFDLEVPLTLGENQIRVLAKNIKTRLTSERFIEVNGLLEGQLNQPGTLYLLAIGVNKYHHFANSDLNAAVADATGLFDKLIRKTPLQRVVARLLVDNPGAIVDTGYDPQRVEILESLEPNAENIVKALEMFERVQPQDMVVIFLAGHGVNEKGRYFFLPVGARRANDGKFLPRSVVSWSIFNKTLASTRGKRILFNDSCHSGNAFTASAFNEKLINDSADDLVIAFSAADSQTKAEEFSKRESGTGELHGIFTDALLRAIEGEADLHPVDKQIGFKELEIYVTNDVKKNSENRQTPEVNARHFKPFIFARQ